MLTLRATFCAKLFNILADLLAWIARDRGATNCLHYLYDFLFMGPPESTSNLAIMVQTCEELGVPLAMGKLEGPSTALTFLGIEIDTSRMEIRLPKEKLDRIRQDLNYWTGRKKATKRQIYP